jgi:hypothetical protein
MSDDGHETIKPHLPDEAVVQYLANEPEQVHYLPAVPIVLPVVVPAVIDDTGSGTEESEF